MVSSKKHLHMKQRDDRPYPDQRGRLSQIGAVKNIDRAINEVYALKSVYSISQELLEQRYCLWKKRSFRSERMKFIRKNKPCKRIDVFNLHGVSKIFDFDKKRADGPYASSFLISSIQSRMEASLGIRQSPRGERQTLPTLTPSGMQFRLNCWVKKRR